MPLFINNKKVKKAPKVDDFIATYSEYYKGSSQQILSQEVKVVGPEQLLYIGQREVAGTGPDDEIVSILGSEDATTCHIGVLRHTGSRATSMLHFDGCSTAKGLESMINVVTKLTDNMASGRLELHLFGGFLDPKHNSHDVSDALLDCLCKCPNDIHLETACITHLNTTHKNGVPFPVIYGIACDVKTGDMFKATFPDKGPDLSLRNARHFAGSDENILIYDPASQCLTIEPFHYDQLPNMNTLIKLPNPYIRKFLSTSPDQEPEGFEESVRRSLHQIRDFPNPVSSVFQGKPRKFRKDPHTGVWALLAEG